MGLTQAEWAKLLAKVGYSSTRNYRADKHYHRLVARRDATRIVLNRGPFVVEVYWCMRHDWWRWEVRHHACPSRSLGVSYMGVTQGRARAKHLAMKALHTARERSAILLPSYNSNLHRLHRLPS